MEPSPSDGVWCHNLNTRYEEWGWSGGQRSNRRILQPQEKRNCCIDMAMINYTNTYYIYIYTHIHAEYILRQWIKTSEDFFKKKIYFSLYLKGFVCERELETEQNYNILTPTLMAISVVSFSFSWCSTGGPGAQLSAGFLYHTLSLTHLISNSLTSCLHRVI